jgi:D-aminoacyl-tRNA deacylase
MLILLGVHRSDTGADTALLARKCAGLRIFPDSRGRMNRSVIESGGEVLVVSQFTLFGDVRRGLRPYFGEAAEPQHANKLYEEFMGALEQAELSVQGGVFGASMQVELVNDGPVSIWIDTRANA